MITYYLQIYSNDWAPLNRQDRIMIDELPFQPVILERLAALGIIDIQDRMMPMEQIERVAKILRLRQSIGVNLSGAAVICELLDKMEDMEENIKRLRHS